MIYAINRFSSLRFEQKETTVVFTNGALRAAADATNKQKRWPDARGISTANGTYIPGQ